MSLINDALKRTRDNGFMTDITPAARMPSYRMAREEVPAIGPRAVILVTALLGVLALCGAGFLAMRVGRAAQQVKGGMAVHSTVVSAPAPITPAPPPPSEEQLVSRVVEKLRAETPVAPPPEPPKLILQGITSQGTAREAMINGCSVRVGDDIQGAFVTAIESRSVRLRWHAQELVLRMP